MKRVILVISTILLLIMVRSFIGWLTISCSGNGNTEMVKFLVTANMITQEEKNEALLLACSNNKNSTVNLLLQQKADANVASYGTGVTCLMLACQNDNKAMVANLIHYKAKIKTVDGVGRSAEDYTEDKEIKLLLSGIVKRRR